MYTSVTETADKVAIVASGSSIKNFNKSFNYDVTTIAVNGAIQFMMTSDV